jgi:hypothetical protein
MIAARTRARAISCPGKEQAAGQRCVVAPPAVDSVDAPRRRRRGRNPAESSTAAWVLRAETLMPVKVCPVSRHGCGLHGCGARRAFAVVAARAPLFARVTDGPGKCHERLVIPQAWQVTGTASSRSHQPPTRRGLNTMYTRRQLEVVLHRERARADRSAGEFSLIPVPRPRGRPSADAAVGAAAEPPLPDGRRARLVRRRVRGDVAAVHRRRGRARLRRSALKLAQESLIPAICRVYTYPSAWYFDEDRHHHNARTRSRRRCGQAAHGGSNGNGNGGGKLMPVPRARACRRQRRHNGHAPAA